MHASIAVLRTTCACQLDPQSFNCFQTTLNETGRCSNFIFLGVQLQRNVIRICWTSFVEGMALKNCLYRSIGDFCLEQVYERFYERELVKDHLSSFVHIFNEGSLAPRKIGWNLVLRMRFGLGWISESRFETMVKLHWFGWKALQNTGQFEIWLFLNTSIFHKSFAFICCQLCRQTQMAETALCNITTG